MKIEKRNKNVDSTKKISRRILNDEEEKKMKKRRKKA